MEGFKNIVRKIIISLAILFVSNIYAQNFSYRMFTKSDGLPCSSSCSVMQDSRGYLWISSIGGLSRFDGKTFKNYGMSDGLPEYFASYVLLEDTLGRIWFHYKEGVCAFD